MADCAVTISWSAVESCCGSEGSTQPSAVSIQPLREAVRIVKGEAKSPGNPLIATRKDLPFPGRSFEFPMLLRILSYAVLLLTDAFTTLPDFRQVVQTRTRLLAPFTRARTGRRFTFQRRRLTL